MISDQRQELQQSITEIKEKLLSLHEINNGDIGASYKESVQTTEMIHMLEIQLANLETQLLQISENNQKFKITDKTDGTSKEFELVKSGADPFHNRVSKDSPMGMLLLKAKNGEEISIAGKVFTVELL